MSSSHILGPFPEYHGGPNALVLPSLLLLIKEKECGELRQRNAIGGPCLCPVRFALRVCPFQDGGFEGLMFKSLARRRGRGATGTKLLPLFQEGGRPWGYQILPVPGSKRP